MKLSNIDFFHFNGGILWAAHVRLIHPACTLGIIDYVQEAIHQY